MNFQLTTDLIHKIESLIRDENQAELFKICNDLLAPDIAEIIEVLDFEQSKYLFDTFNDELGADILIELEEDLREKLLGSLSSKEIVEDLIVSAVNDAKSKIKKKTTEEISKATGGINFPPGFKFPL